MHALVLNKLILSVNFIKSPPDVVSQTIYHLLYVFIGDEAYSLRKDLMWPIPVKKLNDKIILIRASLELGCLLSGHFLEHVCLLIKAAGILHNLEGHATHYYNYIFIENNILLSRYNSSSTMIVRHFLYLNVKYFQNKIIQ